MGVYNTLIVNCKCGNLIELQSKAGNTECESFDIQNCPLDILMDISESGQQNCKKCQRNFSIKINHIPEISWEDH